MRSGSSQRLRWWVYAVVFVIALAGNIRRNDFSPVVHPDTAFEEAIVQDCVRDDGCTTLGGSASFSGIYHMVGWLNFMALAESLGLERDTIHTAIQVANAARIALLMFVADRLGGAPAAALAPYFAFQTGAAPGALYDTSLMAFFGTVLLVQCVAIAAAPPSLSRVVLATLGAAVVSEVHLAGGMAFLSVLWVVLLQPSRRVRQVVVATAVFTAAILLISPMTIAWDLDQLLARAGAASSGASRANHAFLSQLPDATAALTFLLPAIVLRLGRSWLGALPRGLQGALAVCVPVTLAYSIGVAVGVLPAGSNHYLEHAWPARAVAIAVPLAIIASKAWEAVAAGVSLPVQVGRALLWIAPLSFSLQAAWAQPPPERPQPHWADVQSLARLLHDDWQWDWPTVQRAVRSPEKSLLLNDLAVVVPEWPAERQPTRDHVAPVTVVAVTARDVPDPLPDGWFVVSRRTLYALLAIPTPSALQWDAQTACVEDLQGQQQCFDPPVEPRLPWTLQSRVLDIRRFSRRVPWRGETGAVEVVAIPDLLLSCVGRVVQGPPGTEIDATGRSARLTTPGDVVFEWTPNTPGCAVWDFLKQDDPPFVLAGAPATVESMKRMIDPRRP